MTIVWTLLLVFTLQNGDELKERVDTYSTFGECRDEALKAITTLRGRKVKAQCVSKEAASA